MSSTDKTSTTGTITEVKELVEEVLPEKEQETDNIGEEEASKGINGNEKSDIGENEASKGINGNEKSEQVTLDDTKEPEGTEGTNMETDDPKDNKAN